MASYKSLQKKAKQFGLNLWKNGGYYYLSGMVSGQHTQGIFTNLRQIEAELSKTWQFEKVPIIKIITYASKNYSIKIESIRDPPYGLLYINNKFMGSVFPSIRREALIQYIQGYKKLIK